MHALRIFAAAAPLLATLTLGASARAQLASNDGPIEMTSDKTEAFSNEHKAVLTGRVEVLQGQIRLRSDRLVIYYRNKTGSHSPVTTASAGASGMGEIDRAEAYGNVYLVTPTEVVRGDQAVYTADDDTIVVTGRVILTRGESVAEGRRLVVNRTAGTSTLEGDSATRPHIVIYPQSDKADAPH